jgi:hypothetical protein
MFRESHIEQRSASAKTVAIDYADICVDGDVPGIPRGFMKDFQVVCGDFALKPVDHDFVLGHSGLNGRWRLELLPGKAWLCVWFWSCRTLTTTRIAIPMFLLNFTTQYGVDHS